MRQDYSKIEQITVPDGLLTKVMGQLAQENLMAVKRRLAIFSVSAFVSAAAFVPVIIMLKTSLAESGFWQFASLAFSDFKIVSAYWQSFALSLVEALPLLGLIMFLAILLVFLESLKVLTKDLKVFRQLRAITD